MSLYDFEFRHRNDTDLSPDENRQYEALLKSLNIYQNSLQCQLLNEAKIHRTWTALEHIKYRLLIKIRAQGTWHKSSADDACCRIC